MDGNLHQALEVQADDNFNWTEAVIRIRAERGAEGVDAGRVPRRADAFGLAPQAAATGGTVFGTFAFGLPGFDAGMRPMFAATEGHGLALVFHADAGPNPNLRGLTAIADAALLTGCSNPVRCGHACTLSLQTGPNAARSPVA